MWVTCLRSLAFVNVGSDMGSNAESNSGSDADSGVDADILPGDEIYTQEEAYRFLLEVVCGLKI